MARTAGKDPAVMKTKKTPRGKHNNAKSPNRLGQGSDKEWNVRPDKTKPNGARKTKKSRRSHSEWSDNAGIFDMSDSDDDCLPSMEEKQRESGAATPTAISGYRTPPAVKRPRNGSTGGGGSQQVSAPATDDEACQPPTMSAAGTRKRKPEGGGGTSGDESGGGRQRRNRTKRGAVAPAPAPAAAAAATTASTTGSTTSSGPSRRSSRTTSGGGSRGVYNLSPAEARTKIRDALPEELGVKWTRSVNGPSWRNTQRRVTTADLDRHDEISRLKKDVTMREVPDVAAVVGKRPLQEGVVVWPLAAKSLNFPVNNDHLMGGPVEYEGINGATAWRNNVRWPGLDGKPLPDQCATAHYLYEVVDRCALDGVLIVDASGVGHPRRGSGLVRGDADTKRLMKQHIRCLLEGGARIIEVHSASATEHFIDALEEMGTGGSHDLRVPFGSSIVRAHVFFDVPCVVGQGWDTVVVIGTNHHCMMRTPLNAASIVRRQIFASALGGRQLDPEQVDKLWGMVAGATMTNEEWTENYATLLEELSPEELAVFDRFKEQHAEDMNSAWVSLISHRGGKNSWMGQTAGKTVAGSAEKVAAAEQALPAAKTRARRAAAKEALKAATAEHDMVTGAREHQSDGGNASWTGRSKGLNEEEAKAALVEVEKARAAAPEEEAEKADQVVADATKRVQLAKTAKKRRSGGGEASIKKRRKDPRKFKDDCAAGGRKGGEDGAAKGIAGGAGGGYAGAGKKNAELTVKHVERVRQGLLDPGFTAARCSHGADKECGRCEYIVEWNGAAIPDLRPGAVPGAWVALLRSHMIRQRVADKVRTVHAGTLAPWEGDATTGRSLKDDEGVEYLTFWQAGNIVKTYNDLYNEWLKENPDNN